MLKKGKFENDKLVKGVGIIGIGVIIKGFWCGGKIELEFEEELDENIFLKCKCGWFKGFGRKDDGVSGDEMVRLFLDIYYFS